MATGFQLPALWPLPADPATAASLAQDLSAHPDMQTPAATALIACLGGNSPFLSDLVRREREVFGRMLVDGPTHVAAAAIRQLRTLKAATPRAEIAAGLRRAKRQVALAAAIADLGGLWSLEQLTGTLSLLAEASLRVASAHLLLAASRAGQLPLADPRMPERDSGFVVLAMGKLGARELNYSSDIDLVLLYDPAILDPEGKRDDLGRIFSRLATDLVSLMEARDADGYVFRMDLRLRPDPGATPPAVSLPAAIAYYESYGQNWERAAMTKARPVAGDLGCGERFLDSIRPFVWRRHLDFAAIEDIHAMKRRIDLHKPSPARRFGASEAVVQPPGGLEGDDPVGALLGHDLKLGHGGIREIEFIAQTLQLVWGGREPALREPTTLGALSRLADGGYLKRGTADSLCRAYRLLRSVEHRLQMQADRQTHSLPGTRHGLEAFALFMGYPDGNAFGSALLPVLRRTRARFQRMFRGRIGQADDADRPGLQDSGLAPFDLDGADLPGQLHALGFPSNPQALDILQGWRGDRLRALRDPRARRLLHGLMPALLHALAGQRDPVAALVRFDTLLSRQSAGVNLLSLFGRNPALLGRIATVLGASPSLADHLAAVPSALEGLLVPEDGKQAGRTLLRILDQQMRAARDTEEAIRIAHTLVRGEEFRFCVAQLEARLDVDAAGEARSALAEQVITRMLDHVLAEHRARYGLVPGGGMAVVALGKAGSREMMNGSDLDLMLVYDHPEAVIESVPGIGRRGSGRIGEAPGPPPRAIATSQYYTRLVHALIAALTARGIEGPLYALDMRLRPSGNTGPVAVSLGAFRRYHAEQAWTWERMALSRARVVAGPGPLRRIVSEAIGAALSVLPRQTGEAPPVPGIDATGMLFHDASAMRSRLARDLPPHGPWDVKLRSGGLMEVEFIAQVLQLASLDPGVRHPTTRTAFARLARAGMLSRADAGLLIEADRFWRDIQGMLRILLGVAGRGDLPDDLRDVLPEPVIEALLRGMSMQVAGLAGLVARRDTVAHSVRAAFLRLVGPVRPG